MSQVRDDQLVNDCGRTSGQQEPVQNGAPESGDARMRTPSVGNSIKQPVLSSRVSELRWLAENRARYAGQWVVLEGSQLVCHGADAKAVYESAREMGVDSPLLVQVPAEEELPFGGW